MTKWIILTVGALILMTGSIVMADIGNKQIIKTQNNYSMNRPVYELELSRWGVYNDGTHPLETTNGINTALKWAKENNFKTFKIPGGTYLIAKGTKQDDPDARINMISDMDFLLSDNTVLQKETNEFEIYSVLYLGPNVQNVTVKGGTYRGERDTHEYSKKGPDTGGTHEWGYGIQIAGAENILIDDVKIEKFTGDGIIVTATTVTGSTISEESLEIGGINDEGTPVEAEGKIRTNNRAVTHFENASYEKYRNIHFWLPEGIKSGSKANVYYYRKDGSFIRADKQIRFYSGESVIPKDADYFRAVFEAPSIKKVKINRMTVDISKNVTIKNSDIGYNRRQGISLVGSDGVKIYNNHIHHTGGTAPQSGIDIEPGFFPGRDTIIKDNHFTDNKIQIVLAYGENAVIEGNHFEQSLEGAVGVHVHKGFRGDVVVKENTFNGSGLTVNSENAVVHQNKFTKSEVKLLGKKISFSNATMADAMLNIGYKEGQKIENIQMKQSGAISGALFIWDAPVHMKDVTIHANSKNKGIIQGAGNNKSVYDDLVVKGEKHNGIILPAGKYNRCTFEAGTLEINREGKYVLNECTVKNPSNLFSVNNLYGNPEVTIKDSLLEVKENIGYGAAIYVQGAEKFELFNSKIKAENNTENTPLIKLGQYGPPMPTKIFNALIKGNEIHTKTAISGVHTLNAGTDAPVYGVTENKLFNATLELTSKEINEENKLITR